jgi:hypothetical protein
MATLNIISKEDLELFKTELFAQLKQMGIGPAVNQPQKTWLKSVEVRKLLNVSTGTLQNLRIKGILPYTRMGSILYYRREDIQRILNDNLTTY